MIVLRLRLPGECIVCRRRVYWRGAGWRDPSSRERHVCPTDRATCGVWMPNAKERCARRPGHGWEHKTRWALDNALYMRTGRRIAA